MTIWSNVNLIGPRPIDALHLGRARYKFVGRAPYTAIDVGAHQRGVGNAHRHGARSGTERGLYLLGVGHGGVRAVRVHRGRGRASQVNSHERIRGNDKLC